MPSTENARVRAVTIPYSEVAMHIGIAGRKATAIEEDTFINGKPIPEERRICCFVMLHSGEHGRIPMLKSEAGWDSACADETRS